MSANIAYSRRVQAVRPSATMAMAARAGQLKREGKDIVSLTVGEPDFPVLPHVKEAMEAALAAGHTKYTASNGIVELREAIVAWMKSEEGVAFQLPQVIACAGAKQSLFNACQALLDEGDEAVVPNPYWVSYPDMVKLAGAKPVELVLKAENGWVPRPGDLTKVLNDKTRVLILGSPSNPTGAILPEAALRAIAEELRAFPRVVVLSDDIYGPLWYSQRAPNLLNVAPDLADRTVLVHGCSKAFAMTGLRIGWACGPQPIIAAMNKVQDSSTSNPSSIAQWGAVAALRGSQVGVEAMRQRFAERRILMTEALAAIPGVKAPLPDGAFYVFPDVSALLAKKHKGAPVGTTLRLAEILLDEYGLAVVPGSAFGAEGFLRISFAAHEDDLRRGAERLARLAATLA